MNRTMISLAVLAAAAALTAGCAQEPNDRAAPSTVTVPTTSTATAPTAATTTTGRPATAVGDSCLDLQSPVVQRAVAKLPQFSGSGYVAVSGTAARLGTCPDLMWVLADLDHGTGSSPQWVLFFDRNGYLGTDISKPTSLTHVVGNVGDGVAVEYRWLNPGDATAGPTGGPVTVTYTLRGGTVTPDRDVPPQSYGG